MKTIPASIIHQSRQALVASGMMLSGLLWLSPLHAVEFPTDMLPPPTGTLDATQVMTFGTSPVQFKDFSVRLPSSSIAPPAPGTSGTVTFNATAHARASNNGGAVYASVAAPCTVTVSLHASSDGSTCDAEITALSCAFSANVEIRESPTLQSVGRFSIKRCADGTCRIDSFFDIFTELRTGQGQQSSFTPSSSATHFVCRAPSSESPFASASLPPVASAHRSAATVTFPNLVVLRSLSVSNPATPTAPPAPGGAPVDCTTQVTCDGEISTNGGSTFQRFECPASLVVRATHADGSSPAGSPTSCYDTEMLALSLSGGSLPVAMMLRESPTKASLGRTSIRQTSDGAHLISSFFDIFTEVSLDGGQSWSPSSTGACVCALGDDHFFATEDFPFAADYACDNGDSVSFGTTGLVIRNFVHRPSSARSPLPADGVSETRSLDGEASCDVSRDGGATFSRVSMACASSASVTDVSLSSGSKSVSLTLRCSLPPASSGSVAGGSLPVMVRESPTRASTGQTRRCTCPSGYKISSFFDIFTEVSFDNGTSWLPADSSLHLSLLPYVEQDNVFASAYALPRDGSFEMRPEAPPISCDALTQPYLLKKMRVWLDTSRSVSNPLYEEKGDTAVNPLFGRCSGEISSDNGLTWTPVTGTCTGSASVRRATQGEAYDARSCFDTEMLSLSLDMSSGGTTPLSVMVRESPTRASTGRTSVQRLADNSACRMDSFFDVFTELSVDGGASWAPAACAVHLELHAIPDECAMPSSRVPLATVLRSPDPEFKTVKRSGHAAMRAVAFDFSDAPAGQLSRVLPPTEPGSSVDCDSTVPLSFDYCPEGSTTFSRVACDAAVSCRYTREADGSLRCEMLSCAVSGGSLPASFQLRESPTRASLGRLLIRESPTLASVSGFFDIFVEMSTDGGASFEPACSAIRGEITPNSRILRMVMINRLACSEDELLPRRRISSAVLRCASSVAITPPVAGSSSTRFDSGTIDFSYCPDGSTTSTRLHGDVFLRYEMKDLLVSSACTSFDTEMLQLEVSGSSLPTGMCLRESPTRASTGKTCIYPQPDGSSRVSSFFDVFTELSLDGGRTWSALDIPLHYAAEESLPSSSSPDNAWPPPGQFQGLSGDPDFDMLFANGSVVSFFDIFTELSGTRPPLPSVGSPPLEATSTGRCKLFLVGVGDVDCDAAFTTRFTATGTFSDGTTCYDTEMLALSLSSPDGSPLPFTLRESPTKQSRGQTRCRSAGGAAGGGGGCVVDSFFDIFTELSLDNGATWSPCDAPVRLGFVCPEIDVSTPDGTALADEGPTVTVNASITSTITLAGFVVRNTGSGPLTGFSFSFDDVPDATCFSVQNPPVGPLPPGGSAAFKVAFSSSSPGTKSATLHITTNDADEPSFDIPLSARALMPDEDSDDDGLPNDDEVALAGCGFDPLVSSGTETDFLRDNGFFRSSDMRALALGRPVLERDPVSGHFHLQVRLRESPTLQTWAPLTGFSATSNPSAGEIDIDITPDSSDKRFFQVLGEEP